MDIQRADFAEKLPTILKHISEAHFLSFDLELSGIPDQRRNRGNGPKSLAERYKELKIAAETYHILQVGLTCVEEDRTNAKYVVRSYNFNISPLVDEQLDLDRDFTYSTSAVSFLLRHSYNMASPFAAGIPYLTRAETHPAMENALARWDKQAIPDIKIKADDTKALNFMKRVRKEVDIWQKTKLPHKDYYDIVGVPVQDGDTTDATSLNRFEKRLVHQIVRAEYPTLQTFSRTEGVQVQPLDEEEQKRIKETLQQRLNNTLFNQVGFRWVAEAMAGGDLFGLDLDALGYIQGENEPKSREAFERRINTLRNTLAERKKVLIGHNCLLDLIYFFKTFYGPLPETVEEFQQQVEQALTELEVPVFENGSEHASYEDSEQYHEAGFDSYITAKVFLKLAAKIASEHPQTWTLADASSALQDKDQRSSPSSAIPSKSEQIKSTGLPNKIFHKNPYDGLADLEDEEDGGLQRLQQFLRQVMRSLKES
ncbi:hypothetical protein FH972_026706 [Carpinus fangiana]|uniref:CAF1-domain-containing protein n=1 Tax=Carpinus fangiana TaxID=176857 RepID=A0A5N6L4T5_9ROSI|nr:hypothetical protein FH972_026706 [Carpinus fangiana]